MIIFLGAILGAVIGAFTAFRRKGKLADILQYSAVYALIFAIGGLFLTIIIQRSTG